MKRALEESHKTIRAASEETEEAERAKDLKLLADFVMHMRVMRVEFGQSASM